ncbi:glycoside hydrolase family 16 protein [uncultured Chitinophaga sp.]|uniref:glycoside hydrolase family 16 protein n=1 Tax=uncultured Chitinophaga sp. TaxID=339340 RepID=UPI0025E99A85|nr:glycoside hydrolase family 16 protein [uncultured Chitinophaga sp.]
MLRSCIAICALSLLLIIPAAAQQKPGWKLVWQDEFNYTGLPDSSKWRYEIGHVRNMEQQYYTVKRKENIWVGKGVLTITGRKEPYRNNRYRPGSTEWKLKDSLAQYTSASINTEGKASWKYGRVEMKAKLPKGGGMWPAFWMLGINREQVNWPLCGEIDIMEFVGNMPKDVYGTMHWADTGTHKHASSGTKTFDTTISDKFHIYAVEWNEKSIDVYFDDLKYFSFATEVAGKGDDNAFRKEFYLLLNLAMGAKWPGPIDDTVLPQTFKVDYVRVYQRP